MLTVQHKHMNVTFLTKLYLKFFVVPDAEDFHLNKTASVYWFQNTNDSVVKGKTNSLKISCSHCDYKQQMPEKRRLAF